MDCSDSLVRAVIDPSSIDVDYRLALFHKHHTEKILG
jgi:hypothetical protein